MTVAALTGAMSAARFASQNMQAALKTAGPVEALVLLPLIADAAQLEQRISGLITALLED